MDTIYFVTFGDSVQSQVKGKGTVEMEGLPELRGVLYVYK
jgi:hypothetical protein